MPRVLKKIPRTETARRIQEARLAVQLTPRELAEEVGVSVTAVYKWEEGIVTPKIDALERIAHATGKAPEWLMARDPRVKDTSGYVLENIPVVGRGGAGRGQFSVDGFPVGEGWKKLARPFGLKDPNAFGVEVTGASMVPKYDDRQMVICSPAASWKSGDYCVVKTTDGEYMIKKVIRQEGHLVLMSVAHGYDPIVVPFIEVGGVYKIVWAKEK